MELSLPELEQGLELPSVQVEGEPLDPLNHTEVLSSDEEQGLLLSPLVLVHVFVDSEEDPSELK